MAPRYHRNAVGTNQTLKVVRNSLKMLQGTLHTNLLGETPQRLETSIRDTINYVESLRELIDVYAQEIEKPKYIQKLAEIGIYFGHRSNNIFAQALENQMLESKKIEARKLTEMELLAAKPWKIKRSKIIGMYLDKGGGPLKLIHRMMKAHCPC